MSAMATINDIKSTIKVIKWLVTVFFAAPTEEYDDGLNKKAHLERHLPAELSFHGHILKRSQIRLWHGPGEFQWQYLVDYKCDKFFHCASGHEDLWGMMFVNRVPPEQLGDVLPKQLRIMKEQLEQDVAHEVAQGCSIRPPNGLAAASEPSRC